MNGESSRHAAHRIAGVNELPTQVRIREVGPRDGFQNEPEVIPTADKVRLIEALGRTGLKRIEVTSFVRPDVIPQLADAEEILAAVSLSSDVAVSVLIPNERGLERALAHRDRFQEINGFLSAGRWRSRSRGCGGRSPARGRKGCVVRA
jgi:hydroxymethylglutaryl-CoA lyase